MTRQALGRGLDALLPRSASVSPLVELDLEQIHPNPFQPRLRLDSATLDELADSIAQNGLLQPIIVRSRAEGYEIIAGERRWRAAQKAGLQRIPSIVQDISNQKMVEMALVENIQRADLTAIEEAQAYSVLIEEFGLTQEEVARQVGKSRTAVTNTLRLLQLPRSLQQALLAGEISMGHARALLPLPHAQQLELAGQVASKALSVREVERRVQKSVAAPRATGSHKDPHLEAAEQRLEQRWKTKVEIRRRRSRGQIVFHFHSEDELDRLYSELVP
jgi:ParB family chromosome partitioning protein